ncbi:MAG: hypothetical protein AB8H80_15800 [Planctomycetota bacterium]
MNPSREQIEVQRYLDNELSESEAAAFAARMLVDGALRERVAAQRSQPLQQAFAAEVESGAAGFGAPSGFAAGVLAEVRAMPSRQQLLQQEAAASLSDGAMRTCRRLLLAALLLCAAGLAWHAGLLDAGGSGRVEAGPAETERLLEELDERIRQSMDVEDAGLRAGEQSPRGR